MRITLDANAVVSALIKDGLSRRLIFHSFLRFNAPSFLLDELQKHERLVFRKSRLSEEQFADLLQLIIKKIEFIPAEELLPYLPAALSLVEDEKDAAYLAAALLSGSSVLSDDKHLKKQNRVEVYSVEELARELGML